MTFKRILVSLCTVIICMMLFLCGYVKTSSIISYADSTTDNWQQVTTNEQLVEAFKYYCKSRDLTIEGSIADGVTSFTTKTFNGLCNTLGIDIIALQAHLKYETDGNLGTRFLFDSVGISAYNRIFSQFLQDNELEVGDVVNDEMVYSGKYFNDQDGHNCLVYIKNNNVTSGSSKSDVMLAEGTFYLYDWPFFDPDYPGSTITVAVTSTQNMSFTFSSALTNLSTNREIRMQINSGARKSLDTWYRPTNNDAFSRRWIGFPAVIYRVDTDKLYVGYYSDDRFFDNPDTFKLEPVTEILQPNNNLQTCNIYITTNNTVINNNTYEGDTIINNNGEPEGDDNPDTPTYDPYPDGGGTTTGPDNTGGGSGDDDTVITFPDFDFHFPEIDWSLGDLSQKFPFSIPFDLIAFFTVLNAEPQAPAIDTNIPLGSWYTWHFEADFSQFDNYAVIIRNVEFIGFCVALIYLTIRLVKG